MQLTRSRSCLSAASNITSRSCAISKAYDHVPEVIIMGGAHGLPMHRLSAEFNIFGPIRRPPLWSWRQAFAI